MDGNDYTRTAPWVFATDCGRLRNVGVFGQDQIRLFDEKLIFLGGLRYDNATTYDGYYATNGNRSPYFAKYNAQYEDHTWDDLSPRISAKYFFMPNLSAYASYGHAFRAPLLDDMYRTGYQMKSIKMSNPSLGPERSDSFEIGSDYQPVDNLKLSGSGYYSQVYDYMGTVTVGYDSTLKYNLMQVQNIGTVHIWGMELAAEYDPFKFMDIDLLKKMTLFANYTYNESRVVDSSERPDLNGKLVPYVPLHSFNVGYTWLNRFINNRVALQYIGTTYADETNTSYNKIDPHAIINAKLWRNFDFLGKYGENVTMSFTVENLLDSRYFTARNNSVSSPTSVNANETLNVGRTMYLEMSCKF
jgi:iron complex outermembrane recepter protein